MFPKVTLYASWIEAYDNTLRLCYMYQKQKSNANYLSKEERRKYGTDIKA